MSDQVVAPAAAPASATPVPNAAPEASNAASQTPKPAAGKAETYDVMMDGKPVKMTLEEMKQAASLGSAANKRFQEASQMRKQAENILNRMRDPEQAIELLQDPRLGLDKSQIQAAFEKWYHNSVIEPSKLTPEQRKMQEYESKLKKYEDDEKAKQKAEQDRVRQEEDQKADQEMLARIQEDMISILKDYGLPNRPFTRSRVAYWTRVNEMKGINAPKELIVQQVRKEIRAAVDDLVVNSDGDQLISILGDSTVQKLRKHDLQRLRAKKQAPAPAPVQNQQSESNDEDETPRRNMPYVRNFKS